MPTGRDDPMRYGEAPGVNKMGGAKATVAQHKYFKEMQYQERMALKAQRQHILLRAAKGATRRQGEIAIGAADDEDDDSDDDSDLDDGFMEAYRASRLEEMQAAAVRPKRFGALRRDISKTDFLVAVESDAVVVVHLDEPNDDRCDRLNVVLELVARRRPEISFVSIRLAEAGQAFDTDVLPILALYQEGEVIGTLFRVTDDLGDEPEDDLEQLLEANAFAPVQPAVEKPLFV